MDTLNLGDNLIISFDKKCHSTLEFLENQFKILRTDRISPSILDSILVLAYGEKLSITKLCNITVLDSKTMSLKPWDKKSTKDIEKSIVTSSLNISTRVQKNEIIVCVPPLTEEGRKRYVIQAKEMSEQSKINIRLHRKECLEVIRNMKKNNQVSQDGFYKITGQLQICVNKFVNKIEDLFSEKKKKIMVL